MATNARGRATEDGTDLAARLHSAAIHLLRRVRRVDSAMGLSAARASALSVLVFGGPCTIGELAAAEQVTAPTMTRLVGALVAEGYVSRHRDRDDRRVVQVRVTAKGRRALEAGRDARVQEVQSLLQALSPADLRALGRGVDLLERMLR